MTKWAWFSVFLGVLGLLNDDHIEKRRTCSRLLFCEPVIYAIPIEGPFVMVPTLASEKGSEASCSVQLFILK